MGPTAAMVAGLHSPQAFFILLNPGFSTHHSTSTQIRNSLLPVQAVRKESRLGEPGPDASGYKGTHRGNRLLSG